MERGEIRDPVMTLVLSIATCGAYYLYWVVLTCNELNEALGRREYNAGMEVVLAIITCGMWTIWWDWRVANSVVELEQRWGVEPEMKPMVLFISNMFGLGPLFYQRSMNNAWENGTPPGGEQHLLENEQTGPDVDAARREPTSEPKGADGTVEPHDGKREW